MCIDGGICDGVRKKDRRGMFVVTAKRKEEKSK
jgi:hypothetical protein